MKVAWGFCLCAAALSETAALAPPGLSGAPSHVGVSERGMGLHSAEPGPETVRPQGPKQRALHGLTWGWLRLVEACTLL